MVVCILHEPCPEEEPVTVDKWVHATSPSSLTSVYGRNFGLIPQSCASIRYDGALTDPGAPKGIWFDANTQNGGLKSTSIYPLRCSNEPAADISVGLVFDVHWLLASFGTPWRMYRVCGHTTPKGNHIMHYAIVAENEADWFEKQVVWQERNGHCGQLIKRLEPDQASHDFRESYVEPKRTSRDGNAYTKAEFRNYFGGLAEWNAAQAAVSSRRQQDAVEVIGCCRGPSHALGTELRKEGRRFVWRAPDMNHVTRVYVGVFLVPPRGHHVSSDLIIDERELKHLPLEHNDQPPKGLAKWNYRWVDYWSGPSRWTLSEIRITCDGCHMDPIRGVRYKCMACDNFDVCHVCAAQLRDLRCPEAGEHQLRPIGKPGETHCHRIVGFV
mmetsp:Transcript_83354/g.258863  ORF Transcript_83354/g.258863 Transcript_83354/m.258863 type:complete len:384 (+) Transcript_83354:31-1182(+)